MALYFITCEDLRERERERRRRSKRRKCCRAWGESGGAGEGNVDNSRLVQSLHSRTHGVTHSLVGRFGFSFPTKEKKKKLAESRHGR